MTSSDRFQRLIDAYDPETAGHRTSDWEANLGDLDRDRLLRAVIASVRALVLPGWLARRPDDRRPQLAVDAAERWLTAKSPATVGHALAKAKACTAARKDSFGYDHRIAEAARAVASATGEHSYRHIWEALRCVEEELLWRLSLAGEYVQEPEVRAAIIAVLRRELDRAE